MHTVFAQARSQLSPQQKGRRLLGPDEINEAKLTGRQMEASGLREASRAPLQRAPPGLCAEGPGALLGTLAPRAGHVRREGQSPRCQLSRSPKKDDVGGADI